MYRQSNFFSIIYCIIAMQFVMPSCTSKNEKSDKLFVLLPSSYTHIEFSNTVPENEEINPLQYENSYNGGGVAIGDINNDGLDDIYFSGNKVDNKLYLNRGNFKFEDVTEKAGVKGRDSWKTGTTMADVNGDGLLDIYVCHSGNVPGPLRENELFINKGNDASGIPIFKEEAKEYGLADSAFSTHATFFDYDRDGDLDMILLNHSPVRFNNLDETTITYLLHKKDSLTGLKLYNNDHNKFTDVSEKAGINCVRLNYNLGVSIADLNNDGWPDLYISNDYLSPDYLYINNHNGTFTDSIQYMLNATSQFSMGNDVADVNNDGYPDIFTLDMLPEDNHRQKNLFASDNYELFNLRLNTGLHAQYMRNMLHLNNGNGTFSEIAQLSGISNTDWSWSPLFADLDNDGLKDLFITNGYLRDYTNLNFLKFMGDKLRDLQGNVTKATLLELVKQMPSSNQKNYAFKNINGISFSNAGKEWGLDAVSNSNGAAYADLDNDGDLDLVVNNINQPAFIYKNQTRENNGGNYLSVKMQGVNGNTKGIGAKVYVFANGIMQLQEQLMSRGFQSSVSPILVFGLGRASLIDSLRVIWQNGKEQLIKGIAINKQVLLKEADAVEDRIKPESSSFPVMTMEKPFINFTHKTIEVNDFKRQPLLPNAVSYRGPCIAKSDVNADGLEDLFIGGGTGQAGQLFIQQRNKTYKLADENLFVQDAASDDVDAIFFDADNDGDNDLLVCSGGYGDYVVNDTALQPRLYINDGRGNFSKTPKPLPHVNSSGGCIAVADINMDGYKDIFWGGRVVPGAYPAAPSSYIFLNDGKGGFEDKTKEYAPELANAGMFTDAVFADINNDKLPDLITCGEWMPVQIWINEKGKLTDKTNAYFDKPYRGWWNKIILADINADGKTDIIAGNYGLNTQCKVSDAEPAEMFYKDFDNNGAIDPIFCFYIQGKSYPYVARDELLDQISVMRTRFTDYESYSRAALTDIFKPEELSNTGHLLINTLQSALFLSNASGKYEYIPLPLAAQYAPVFAIQVLDYNADGKSDLLIGGNTSHSRVKIGNAQASYGMLFKGDGSGHFEYIPQKKSGLSIKGDIRFIESCRDGSYLFGINNKPVVQYKLSVK